jgi:hypothetical protein
MRSPTLPVDFTGDSKADRKPRIARLRRDWRAHRLVSAVSTIAEIGSQKSEALIGKKSFSTQNTGAGFS